ncbi:MAG: TlpA family protein disulfide reductase [Bacteroides sp.]|nr:TlpA family protein disulfide reductase [Bacteroides sp.]
MESIKKSSGFNVDHSGEITKEDIFASIVSKFRGKTILVDIWATWCGPCIMANREMKPMKDELAGKDIVYIYLAGENSPLGRWSEMIEDIDGEHYRLTDEQWEYVRNSFNSLGVPTYIVLDGEANVIFTSVGFPGVTKMKEELMKALN